MTLSRRQARQLTDTAYLAAATALLWVGLYYLPVGGVLFRLALPLPLTLLQLRHNGRCAVEGVTVTSTKQARTDRNQFSASARVDSNGSRRGTLDFNWAASSKFALRVNALSADDRGFRDDEIKVQQRLNLVATVKPFRRTTIRADHENFSIKTNVVPLKWAMDSGYQNAASM